jgi:hypothetical protein
LSSIRVQPIVGTIRTVLLVEIITALGDRKGCVKKEDVGRSVQRKLVQERMQVIIYHVHGAMVIVMNTRQVVLFTAMMRQVARTQAIAGGT